MDAGIVSAGRLLAIAGQGNFFFQCSIRDLRIKTVHLRIDRIGFNQPLIWVRRHTVGDVDRLLDHRQYGCRGQVAAIGKTHSSLVEHPHSHSYFLGLFQRLNPFVTQLNAQ